MIRSLIVCGLVIACFVAGRLSVLEQNDGGRLTIHGVAWGDKVVDRKGPLIVDKDLDVRPAQVAKDEPRAPIIVKPLVSEPDTKILVVKSDDEKKDRYKGSINTSVSGFRRTDVLAYINRLTGLVEDDFDARLTLPEVSQALYDISRTPKAMGEWDIDLRFSLTAYQDGRVKDPQAQLKMTQHNLYRHKLFMSFSVPRQIKNPVLVKLSRNGIEDPILIQRHVFSPRQRTPALAIQLNDPWESGDYQIEIFDVKDDFEPVAGGYFSVLMKQSNKTVAP